MNQELETKVLRKTAPNARFVKLVPTGEVHDGIDVMDAIDVTSEVLAMQSATGIEAKVCADIAKRQAFGIAKYGVTVQDNPLALRDWLQHAYEECLDQAVYLRRAIGELDNQQNS